MDEEFIYRNDGNTTLLALLPAAAGTVLDCGCGPGDNAQLLRDKGWAVTAITVDPAERDAARHFCDEVYLADLEAGLPTDVRGTFDVVLMSHVLEHLAQPGRLLEDAHSRLSAEGVLAVALPNVLHYRRRVGFLRGDFTYTETGVLDRTHLRFYTFRTGRRLLEEHGFDIVSAIPDGTLPWMRLRGLVPTRLRTRVDRWALRHWPNLFAVQSLFIARVAR